MITTSQSTGENCTRQDDTGPLPSFAVDETMLDDDWFCQSIGTKPSAYVHGLMMQIPTHTKPKPYASRKQADQLVQCGLSAVAHMSSARLSEIVDSFATARTSIVGSRAAFVSLCALRKAPRRNNETSTTILDESKEMALKRNCLFPGQRISVDHYQSSQSGRLYTSRGSPRLFKSTTSTIYQGGAIYIGTAHQNGSAERNIQTIETAVEREQRGEQLQHATIERENNHHQTSIPAPPQQAPTVRFTDDIPQQQASAPTIRFTDAFAPIVHTLLWSLSLATTVLHSSVKRELRSIFTKGLPDPDTTIRFADTFAPIVHALLWYLSLATTVLHSSVKRELCSIFIQGELGDTRLLSPQSFNTTDGHRGCHGNKTPEGAIDPNSFAEILIRLDGPNWQRNTPVFTATVPYHRGHNLPVIDLLLSGMARHLQQQLILALWVTNDKNRNLTTAPTDGRDCVMKLKNYASVVADMLLHLASNSRPDIAFAVHQAARFFHNPKASHAKAINTLFATSMVGRDLG